MCRLLEWSYVPIGNLKPIFRFDNGRFWSLPLLTSFNLGALATELTRTQIKILYPSIYTLNKCPQIIIIMKIQEFNVQK